MQNSWNLPLHKLSESDKKRVSTVWDLSHLCYEQNLFGQVTALAYSNNGGILGCTSSNQIALVRVPQSEGVLVNTQTERKNFSLHFRDDDKLYVQAVDQRVIVKSTETAFERVFSGHTRDVHSVLFLGRHNFVSASDDTSVKLWDLLSDAELETGRVHTDYVRCLDNYTSGCFFSGSYDHHVNLWDPRAGLSAPISHTKDALTAGVECLHFIRKENILSCGSGDQIFLFDMRKGLTTPLSQASLHTKSVVSLAYSEKYNTLISSALDNRVKMLVLDGGEIHCINTKKFDDPVTCVSLHPESKEFAVGCTSGALKVFKLKENTPTSEQQALEEAGLVERS
ncbi:U3 small nucleolar RNA-associated protein 15 [Angomonas deanei]|nr:U3 small nucleolar RNA-associated protein 15 [Angomonas deanei]|eukprot:EPY37597.1 U3 small nucleolar RNA-associated protein 15 [Angomonas deanei]